jgi:hypothetical protein
MGQDVSGDIADDIGKAKVFGSSENIRHGKYKFLIKRIHAELIESDKGKHKMAFWEVTPLESLPNPQVEGDHVDYPLSAGPLKDDGNKPNSVGSECAMKVDFDGPGAQSAGSNIKEAILALFNKKDSEISATDVTSTWRDLSLQKDLNVGDIERVVDGKPVYATKFKPANPACGMVIGCTTQVKRKRKANEKGAFVTKLVWHCVAPIGTGENAPELVAKRRADIEASMDDVPDETVTVPTTAMAPAHSNGTNGAQAQVPPPPPAAVVAPPPPPAPAVTVAAVFPPAGWYAHPGIPGSFHDGKNVKTEAELRAATVH